MALSDGRTLKTKVQLTAVGEGCDAATIAVLQPEHEALVLDADGHKMFSSLLSHFPLPAWVYDPATLRFLEVNEAAVAHYGYTREQFLTLTIKDIRPAEELPRLTAEIGRLSTSFKNCGLWRHCKANGELIDVGIFSCRFSWKEQPVVLVVAEDVSAQQQAETRAALLESAMLHANDVVVITEADCLDEPGPRICYTNPAFTRMTGFSAAEALGRSPRMLQGPRTDRAALKQIRAALEASQPVQLEIENYARDGSSHWVDLSITPVFDPTGRPSHFVSVQRDITDRKRTEQLLREREAFFRSVVETACEGIWILDAEGRTLHVNERTCELLGRNAGLSQTTCFFDVVDELERERLQKIFAQLQVGQTIRREVLLRRQDRSELWVFMSARHLESASGYPQGTLVMLADATESRQLQAQHLELELAHMRMDELEKLNQLKDDFVSAVSHELRTPLANMRLAIRMLEQTIYCGLRENSKAEQYWEILKREGEREAEMIDELLDLQRLETGRFTSRCRSFELGSWLQRVVAPFVSRAEQRAQKLVAMLDTAADTQVVSDPDVLERVLRELLHNACKYTPPGGLIEVSAAVDARTLSLRVANQGAVIPPEHLPHIFNKFYRVPGSDRWQQGGTGLGLALVRRFLDSLGGTIAVTSAANCTEFVVQLAFTSSGSPAPPGGF